MFLFFKLPNYLKSSGTFNSNLENSKKIFLLAFLLKSLFFKINFEKLNLRNKFYKKCVNFYQNFVRNHS